jgi:4-carboxymuconolactone decarboxylase
MSEKIVQTAGRNALGEFAPEFAHYMIHVLIVDRV